MVHYPAKDYGGADQVWMSAQDSRGFIYWIDAHSLIQYDGTRWRKLPQADARYLLIDAEDRIYLHGKSFFGSFKLDDMSHEKVSLVERLPESQRNYGEATGLAFFRGGVVFATERYLFFLRPDGEIETLGQSETGSFQELLPWDDRLYIGHKERALLQITPEGPVAIEGTEGLQDLVPRALLAESPSSALLLTQRRGTFRLRSGRLERASLPADPFLAENWVYHAFVTSDGRSVVSTRRGGAVVLDDTGHLREIFDRDVQASINHTIYHAQEDRQGNLWLSTDFGVVRVPRSPARLAVRPDELDGTLHRTYRHRGRFYIATRTDLYRRSLDDTSWEKVPGVDSGTWFLLADGKDLLAAGYDGIFRIRDMDGRAEKICSPLTVGLFRSRHLPGKILAGGKDGLRILSRKGDRWECGPPVEGLDGMPYETADGPAGELLVRTSDSMLHVVTFPRNPEEAPRVRTSPLPAGLNELLEIDGEVFLSNDETGMHRYRETSSGPPFRPDPSFRSLRPETVESQVLIQYESEDEMLFLSTEGALEVAEPSGEDIFERRRITPGQISFWCDIYRDSQTGLYWLTNSSGVFSWDPHTGRAGPPPETRLRRVLRAQRPDAPLDLDASPALPYAEGSLRFEYAAPVFDQLEPSLFQTRLEGFDHDWSSFTEDGFREYTHLREGSYRFRVRSRDGWGTLSEEASYAFKIRPPAYRTGWAYLLYALALASIVALAFRRHRKLITRERDINDRLREVDRLKDEFLATTSHELRTPLHGITGLAESLLDEAGEETSDTLRSNLSMIVVAGRRLGHLVDDLLDLSKLRRERLELRRRPVDVHSVVEGVLALCRPLVERRRPLELRNEVPAELPAADADENRLQQILYNLVGNAVKFTDSGSVTVSAEARDDHLLLRVTDTGIGIDEEQQKRIFNLFEQADATVERAYGGTGMGLAISSQLVELHGGSLEVESTLGEGSTFFFRLPVAATSSEAGPTTRVPVVSDAPAFEPGPGEPPSKPSEKSRARLLLVDDEPINLHVLANYLAVENFSVALASSGAEALELLEQQSFDLVLLDVMMPKMSGYEVCRVIRQSHSLDELPVLFLSALERIEDRVTGLESGANDYLVKPVSKAEVVARIKVHLELLEAQRRKSREVETLKRSRG